jgi:glyoxylase-like metal-dependent hydrolase (beta-lactamase superfamily II)
METGRFHIEQLSEGFFEIFGDGILQKMEPKRLENLKDDKSLGKYSSAIGIDPLFITDGNIYILLDSGLGWGLDHNSDFRQTSNVVTNLEIFGVQPDDIRFVVLTHLHYDHAAGSTYVNPDIETSATFPNAEYLVQKREWDFAVSSESQQSGLTGAGYNMDELYKLAAEDRLHFIDKDSFELVPGIDLLFTGGHTPGHQIVRVSDNGQTAYYPGDLIPTEYHLNHYAMKQLDHNPLQSKKFKTLLLKEAFNSGAYLFFYHSLYRKNGKLARDEHKKYVLLES